MRAPEAHHGVASAMAPAVDVELSASSSPIAPSRPQFLAAVLVLLPRSEAADTLGPRTLRDLPGIGSLSFSPWRLSIGVAQLHRSETHLRRDPGPPIANRRSGERLQIVAFTASSVASTSHAHRR